MIEIGMEQTRLFQCNRFHMQKIGTAQADFFSGSDLDNINFQSPFSA